MSRSKGAVLSESLVQSTIVITSIFFLLPTTVHAVDGTSTGICYCAVSRDHRPCRSCPGGGPIPEPPRPTPGQLKKQKEAKDLREAADDASDKGVSFYEKGDWENAVKYFKEALEYDPDDQDILHNLRRAEQKAKDASDARMAKAAARSTLETRIKNLRQSIAKDQQAIRSLGFEKRAEDFEAWERLSDEAQAEFVVKTLDSLFTVALLGQRKMASLSPPTANRIITELKNRGIGDPYLFDAIRGVAATAGKPEMAEAVKKVGERLLRTKEAILIAKESPKDISKRLEALATVLSWGLRDPQLEFAVANAKVIAYSYYSATASAVSAIQIQRLTDLTTEQLQDLTRLSARLQGNVKDLQRAKAELLTLGN